MKDSLRVRSRAASALFAALALAAVPACAQAEPPRTQEPKDAKEAQEPQAKPRVHLIGASVTAGFEDGPAMGASEASETVPLRDVVAAWAGDAARVTSSNPFVMLQMFLGAEKHGRVQVDGALKAKPDLVIALDFPFWFAYGFVRGGDERAVRGKRFEAGLALLAEVAALGVPVVVGDLPDMRGAERRMLSPDQIPSPAVLKELNARLAAFVAEHPKMRLVPLASLVATMKTEGVVLDFGAEKVKAPPGSLLQGDKLHANRLGMAHLGAVLQQELRAAAGKDSPLAARELTLADYVRAARAGPDLDALREAAAEPAATAPANGGK